MPADLHDMGKTIHEMGGHALAQVRCNAGQMRHANRPTRVRGTHGGVVCSRPGSLHQASVNFGNTPSKRASITTNDAAYHGYK